MKASLNWLNHYVKIDDLTPEEIADKLTFAGIEVEGISRLASADKLVIGEILSCEKHPDSDHLHVLQVNEGAKYGIHQIVCGAPNARKGLKVIVAREGAKLPGGVIEKSLIRGVESDGMIFALILFIPLAIGFFALNRFFLAHVGYKRPYIFFATFIAYLAGAFLVGMIIAGIVANESPSSFSDGTAMMAKAIANALDGAFFSVRCSDILSKWVGGSEQNVKNLFDAARRYKVAIIFFDEFEAIGAKRDDEDHGRVLLSKQTLDDYRIAKDVTLIGVLDHFEIWDATSYARYQLQNAGNYEILAGKSH